jgi:hypothetical protein
MGRLSLGSVRLRASCQLVSTVDEQGAVLAKRRIADGLAGVTDLHALVARHAEDPGQVVVGLSWIVACWWGRCWPPATRSMGSTRWRQAATATGM